MVHGWPDTYRLWDAQVEHLKAQHRCIRFTLPGFDDAQPRKAYTVDEVTELIRQVIEQLSPGRKVTLVHAEDPEPELEWVVAVGLRRADAALVPAFSSR